MAPEQPLDAAPVLRLELRKAVELIIEITCPTFIAAPRIRPS